MTRRAAERSPRPGWPPLIAVVLAHACGRASGAEPEPVAGVRSHHGRQADASGSPSTSPGSGSRTATPTAASTSTPRPTSPRRSACRRRTSPGRRPTATSASSCWTSGEADLIVSTFSITDERKQVVDFAGPYFVAHQDLLVRRNDTEITGPETLDGKNLCSVPGTTSAAYVKSQLPGQHQADRVAAVLRLRHGLANSEVDAVTTDDVILAGFAAQHQYQGKLKVVGKGFSDELYGVGVKKGDTDMVDKVNAALKQYIDDGSWRKSLDTNVRPSGYSIPSPPTVAD